MPSSAKLAPLGSGNEIVNGDTASTGCELEIATEELELPNCAIPKAEAVDVVAIVEPACMVIVVSIAKEPAGKTTLAPTIPLVEFAVNFWLTVDFDETEALTPEAP